MGLVSKKAYLINITSKGINKILIVTPELKYKLVKMTVMTIPIK
jgi:hypothetical protein